MKHQLLLLSALVTGSLFSNAALAEDVKAPATRAEVKAEANAAHVGGDMKKVDLERNPSASNTKPRATGDNQPVSRAEVRTETKAARANGELPMGDSVLPPSEKKQRPVSTKSRAEVKADVPLAKDRATKSNDYDPKVEPKQPTQ